MSVSKKDIPIILSLIKLPTANIKEIKEEQDKVLSQNLSTIHRRVKRLENKKIISGAIANLNYSVLDMMLHSFVVEIHNSNWPANIELIEKFCDAHPYTAFRNRIFGKINGIFIQFNLPKRDQSIDKLLETFNILKINNIIKKFDHFPILRPSYNYTCNLSKWDSETNSWDINFNIISEMLENQKVHDIPSYIPIGDNLVDSLLPLDLIIIRENTRNARRSQNQIRNDVGLDNTDGKYYDEYSSILKNSAHSKQSFSRRFQLLNDNDVFLNFSLVYDRQKFGMFNQALFVGKINKLKLARLIHIIENHHLPLPSSISLSEDSFHFWINLPPVELMEITNVMVNAFNDLDIYFFSRKNIAYFFWHENYDFKTKYWKTSKSWISEEPLALIGIK